MEESKNGDKTSPHHDAVQSARAYAQIAGVLAGFAFTAVILVMQINPQTPRAADLRDWAAAAFMLAFFGCISAASTFAMLSGSTESTRRSHSTALFGATGLAISTVFALWGLGLLAEWSLQEKILDLTRYMVLFSICAIPAFLVFQTVDTIRVAKGLRFSFRLLLSVGLPIYLPVIAAVLIGITDIPGLGSGHLSAYFLEIAAASFGVVILALGGALLIHQQSPDFRLPWPIGIGMILLQCCISGALILTVKV